MPRRRPRAARSEHYLPRLFVRPERSSCRALLVIDNAPLQAAAWRELGEARRQLEKSARDLHRHETVDTPAFRTWLGATFPQRVNELRDLADQVQRDEAVVESVMAEAFLTGRSERAVWRDRQRPPQADGPRDPAAASAECDDDWAEAAESFFDNLDFGSDLPSGAEWDPEWEDGFGSNRGDHQVPDPTGATESSWGPSGETDDQAVMRACYRRMAGRLHPDRGGEWTPERERLWHEVQQAWAARDADWLMRLETEWEMETEIFGPHSPLGRLYDAVREARFARRDVERKLRHYRKDLAWRFSAKKVKPGFVRKILHQLEHDLMMLRGAAAQLAGQIAAWSRAASKRRKRRKR